MLLELPHELVVQIVFWLDSPSFLRLALVCKQLLHIVLWEEQQFWRERCQRYLYDYSACDLKQLEQQAIATVDAEALSELIHVWCYRGVMKHYLECWAFYHDSVPPTCIELPTSWSTFTTLFLRALSITMGYRFPTMLRPTVYDAKLQMIKYNLSLPNTALRLVPPASMTLGQAIRSDTLPVVVDIGDGAQESEISIRRSIEHFVPSSAKNALLAALQSHGIELRRGGGNGDRNTQAMDALQLLLPHTYSIRRCSWFTKEHIHMPRCQCCPSVCTKRMYSYPGRANVCDQYRDEFAACITQAAHAIVHELQIAPLERDCALIEATASKLRRPIPEQWRAVPRTATKQYQNQQRSRFRPVRSTERKPRRSSKTNVIAIERMLRNHIRFHYVLPYLERCSPAWFKEREPLRWPIEAYRFARWNVGSARADVTATIRQYLRGRQGQHETTHDTTAQRHNDTTTQRHDDTTTQRQRHNDTTTQRHNDTTTQRHNDTTTQRTNTNVPRVLEK
jgi:hypothetical protein